MKHVVLYIIFSALSILAAKRLTFTEVQTKQTASEGHVIDFIKLNAEMENKWASIDLATGILTIGFDYTKQGWFMLEDCFDGPKKLLITLKDRYNHPVDQFVTEVYFWPSEVIEAIKICPILNPSRYGTPIEKYNGEILKKTGNKIKYELGADLVDLTAKIAVSFNTNQSMPVKSFRHPPYADYDPSWCGEAPVKRPSPQYRRYQQGPRINRDE